VQYVGRGGGHLKPLAIPYGPIDITRGGSLFFEINFLREGGCNMLAEGVVT